MRSTLLKLALFPVVAAAAALAGHTAQAETIDVPFAFSAMGHQFPAGTYSVNANINTNVVTLRLKNSDKAIASVLGPGNPNPGDQRVVLRFTDADGQHVLDTIQFRDKITTRLAPYDPHAREAAHAAGGNNHGARARS